jgi:predicted nucleotidyltransferase
MSILTTLAVPEEAIAEFCRKWQITELALFGSAARGEIRPDSDIDVMVTFGPETRWSLGDFVDMQEDLQTMFGRDVDLVEKGSIHNPFRRRSIMRDLTVVYAA